jgi:hypothetical protein
MGIDKGNCGGMLWGGIRKGGRERGEGRGEKGEGRK